MEREIFSKVLNHQNKNVIHINRKNPCYFTIFNHPYLVVHKSSRYKKFCLCTYTCFLCISTITLHTLLYNTAVKYCSWSTQQRGPKAGEQMTYYTSGFLLWYNSSNYSFAPQRLQTPHTNQNRRVLQSAYRGLLQRNFPVT